MNDLVDAIARYGVNLAQVTPTVAAGLFVPEMEFLVEKGLRTVVLGGEAVKRDLVEGLLSVDARRKKTGEGRVRVFNGYGPSECSVYTTCNGPLRVDSETANIGRPLAGRVWVVGETYGTLAPVGGIGELWVEGPLLARGYLNDGGKTAKSFVVDPHWAVSFGEGEKRFYRTGDLVRMNAKGEVLYVGRKDGQVKIRGQRVEMGEIECRIGLALGALAPGECKTVVVTLINPGRKAGNPTLVVSVEPSIHTMSDTGDDSDPQRARAAPVPLSLTRILPALHSALVESLPSYMVPKFIIPLSRLPRTASSKVDRRALQNLLEGLAGDQLAQYTLSPDVTTTANTEATEEKTVTLTPTEAALRSLWATILNVDTVSKINPHSHFLYLGGDSFTAMRLVAKADGMGLKMNVADVFRFPRLEDMAAAVVLKGRRTSSARLGGEEVGVDVEEGTERFALWEEVNGGLDGVAALCGIPAELVEDVYPCTPLQEGLMAVTAQRPRYVNPPYRSCISHPNYCRAYINRWVYHLPSTIDLERFQQAWIAVGRAAHLLRTRIILDDITGHALQVVVGDDILIPLVSKHLDQYLLSDDETPMTYGTSLARLAVISTQERQYFSFTAHHSIYDGWSWTKLFEAMARAYHGESLAPSPPFSRLIEHLSHQDSEQAARFWRTELSGAEHILPFPPRPIPSYRPNPVETVVFKARAPSTTGMVTSATLLRAAWALVVSSHTATDVVFGAVLTGRTAPVRGIFDMLGPTITTVPIRICVDRAQSVVEFLDDLQKKAVAMMPYGMLLMTYVGSFCCLSVC